MRQSAAKADTHSKAHTLKFFFSRFLLFRFLSVCDKSSRESAIQNLYIYPGNERKEEELIYSNLIAC